MNQVSQWLFDCVWGTKELPQQEPGAMDVVKEVEPGAKSMTWTDQLEAGWVSPEALREMLILEPLKDFNTAEFFIALQFALLVYYPAVALGILWQDEMQQQQCSDHYMDQMQQQQSQFMRFIQSMMRDVITQTRPTERMKRDSKKAISMNGDAQSARAEVMIKVTGHEMDGEEGRQRFANLVYAK